MVYILQCAKYRKRLHKYNRLKFDILKCAKKLVCFIFNPYNIRKYLLPILYFYTQYYYYNYYYHSLYGKMYSYCLLQLDSFRGPDKTCY